MAQMGMFVPARSARYVFQNEKQAYLPACLPDSHFRLCPVDAILTRMGAYDNMFSNSSTFKVELDEW
jgi:DNA mismatch repair ATPase MutS